MDYNSNREETPNDMLINLTGGSNTTETSFEIE